MLSFFMLSFMYAELFYAELYVKGAITTAPLRSKIFKKCKTLG